MQGIAALAVFDPAEPAAANAGAMTESATATRRGAVAVASREALTGAGPCRPGDVLGMVDGDIVEVGRHLEEVGLAVLARLLSSGGELATIVCGEDAGDGLGQALATRIRQSHRDVEVTVIDGGQPLYPLLLGVE